MIDFDALSKRLEKLLIESVLECSLGSIASASRFLRINYQALEIKIALYQIDISKFKLNDEELFVHENTRRNNISKDKIRMYNSRRNYTTNAVMAGGAIALNELQVIYDTLIKNKWVRIKTAKELGISVRKIRYKINQLKNMGYTILPNPERPS
jgi:DNA-binding NtrC family response regulator